jgi:quercetin dioxygenase-like cupin family protein
MDLLERFAGTAGPRLRRNHGGGTCLLKAHTFSPKAPTAKNPPEQFAGDAWGAAISYPQEDCQAMVVARVRFAPGAHTAWHSYAKGQTLHVTSGVALFGTRDGTVGEAKPGETV